MVRGLPRPVLRLDRASRRRSATCGPRSSSNYPGLKSASTGNDGKQYFVPFYNYPWVVIYSKSLCDEKGYTVPTTLDEFIALAEKMQADGLVPVAFGDKDGWPAMGTFDILNMRINGYEFHIDLMAGKEKWTDPRVKAVFETWAYLLPYSRRPPSAAPGRKPRRTCSPARRRHVLPGHVRGRAGR